ncbi:MAG TPA: lysyl oxidase family protein [Longimicrobium sp.]|nr:lysyl oxidase family protein [Longimicrobium sp.]
MRSKSLVMFGFAAVLVAAACEGVREMRPGPTEPAMGKVRPNLDGTPDLVVDVAQTANSWGVFEETFTAGQCSVEEGNIPTGTHRSLRFSVLINNHGTGDLVVGDPLAHMDPNGDGNFSDQDGLFEFASCHRHFHFRNYATYELLPVNADGSYGSPVQSRKRGFCMLDTTPANSDAAQPEAPYYRNCGNLTIHGNQGISKGWGDEYTKWLPGQLFLLTDPNEPVAPGKYVIRIVANPPFTPQNGEPCPATDSQGKCHMFAELSYENNVGIVPITIPAGRLGKTGYGPGSGEVLGEQLDPHHHPEAHAAH